ncbi:MAG: DUF177 domain-containing protein [Paramuribaculum sp.]|nr:DUF177 domain-containing protein [Paramuribaculum sp.]
MSEGRHEFTYHLDKTFFVNMESSDIHDADVDVTLVVTRKNDAYDMAFTFKGTLTLICDRCLDDLLFPVDTTYHITVEYGDEYRDESDDLMIIPESDPYLNVSFIIYDTVALTIPLKHVHPLGKCNRAMSAMLRKHRAHRPGDEDADLEDDLIDEMEAADDGGDTPTDPRWNALSGLGSKESQE